MMKLWNPEGASTVSRDNPCLREDLLLEALLFSALPIDVMIFFFFFFVLFFLSTFLDPFNFFIFYFIF